MSDNRKAELEPAEITWADRLDGGVENPSVWRGKISAKLSIIKERFKLASEEAARQKLDELKEKIGHFYVVAGLKSVVRCIDGRGEEGSLPDNSDLGPQVPGGTPVTSIGYRFAKGLAAEGDIVSTFAEYRNLVESLGLPYISGAHEDEHNASDPENTGCGAIDKSLEILDIMREYDLDEDGNKIYRVYDYAKAIAGEHMDGEAFDSAFGLVQENLEKLNEIRDQFFKEGRFRSDVVDEVKEGGEHSEEKTVERLTGEHQEVFLMINLRDGETFDRDGFAASNDGLAQAFNYDVWVINQRAKDVFPRDEEKQRIMLVTNIMYAVGTAMALTDGSLELGIRQ